MASGCVPRQSSSWWRLFIVCAVALDCSLANVDSDMRMVGSTDLAYFCILPNISCKWFITSGPADFYSSFFIGSRASAPYLFGAEGYGAYCGLFDTSCLYFFSCLVTYPGIEISTYIFYIMLP